MWGMGHSMGGGGGGFKEVKKKQKELNQKWRLFVAY